MKTIENKRTQNKYKADFQEKLESAKVKFIPIRKAFFTQYELAEVLGVTRQHIINFEKGKSNDPYLVYCYKKLFKNEYYRNHEQESI